MRSSDILTEDELGDLKTAYKRLKAKRDQLDQDSQLAMVYRADNPEQVDRLKRFPPPKSLRLVPARGAEQYDRKERYHKLMHQVQIKRIIDMNHELEMLRARIRMAQHAGAPEQIFSSFDSQKTGYQKTYLHEIGMMIDQADGSLPYPASEAITVFVGHPYSRSPEQGMGGGWSWRTLEDAYSPNPSDRGVKIHEQLTAAFAPIRAALQKLFGDTITIHRAQRPLTGKEEPRYVLSWTSNLKFAQALMGDGFDLLTKDVRIDDIVWITDRANQSEFIVRNW